MKQIEFICTEKYKNLIPEPYPSYKKIPDWYLKTKNLEHSKCPFKKFVNDIKPVKKLTNIKTCPAVSDAINTGYIIPSWTNFMFRKIDNQIYFNWENTFEADYEYHHRNDEFEGMNDFESPQFNSFNKISSPWAIKTSPGISCIVTHPFWSREKRFTTVSGVVHTDVTPILLKWFFELNMNLENNLEIDEVTKERNCIVRGEPLILIIPFVRENFESNVSYISDQEYLSNIRERALYATHDWFGKSIYGNFRTSIGKLFK